MHPEDRINVPLLRKVVEHIEAHPEEFLMESYWEEEIRPSYAAAFDRPLTCGSAGCIAGWTVVMMSKDGAVDLGTVESDARQLLGLSESEGRELFEPNGRGASGLCINDIDNDPGLVRTHVEKTLGIRL